MIRKSLKDLYGERNSMENFYKLILLVVSRFTQGNDFKFNLQLALEQHNLNCESSLVIRRFLKINIGQIFSDLR